MRTAALLVAPPCLLAILGLVIGPNSGFGAVLALALALLGIYAGAGDRGRRRVGWLVYGGVALGQWLVVALVLSRLLADRSLVPLLIAGHPDWHHVAAHGALQLVYLAAFVSGRVLESRYRRMVTDLQESLRAVSLREALLREARADYQRAFLLGRQGLRATEAAEAEGERARAPQRDLLWADRGAGTGGASATLPGPAPPTRGDAGPLDRRPEAEERLLSHGALGDWRSQPDGDAGRSAAPARTASGPPADGEREREVLVSRAFGAAFASKMLGFSIGVSVLCLGGAVLLFAIARERLPRHVAWACMGGALFLSWLHPWLGRRSLAQVYWPWALIGVLSVGPAWSLGLHSGFAAVVTTLLFFGGLFRTPRPASMLDRRGLVLAGVCLAHGACFLLMRTGALPDLGNVPVLREPGPAAALHLLLQCVYVSAFVAGHLIERRHRLVASQIEAAAEEAARTEALLFSARAALHALLSEKERGLFSGQRVGPYQLHRLVGRGGMGEVYEAKGPTARRLALKLLRRERVGDPRSLLLFEGEAAAVAQVKSQHVASVLEVGGLDGELPFIAMEYMGGGTLSDLLRDRGRLSLAETVKLAADVATGLRDIHSAGVLHRDVKPQNIMRGDKEGDERWRLVDFGIAQLQLGAQDLVAGTPAYMAPEQVGEGRVDVRADLYSLSLVIYRCLAGRSAYSDEDPRRRGRPPDPRIGVDLPPDVELALRVGLAERPEERFTTAAELREMFCAAAEGRLPERLRLRGRALADSEPWAKGP